MLLFSVSMIYIAPFFLILSLFEKFTLSEYYVGINSPDLYSEQYVRSIFHDITYIKKINSPLSVELWSDKIHCGPSSRSITKEDLFWNTGVDHFLAKIPLYSPKTKFTTLYQNCEIGQHAVTNYSVSNLLELRNYVSKHYKRNFLRIAITYSSNCCENSKILHCKTALDVGNFDLFIYFSPDKLDNEYRNRNSHILNIRRGGGLWIWKSHIIYRTLSEMCNDDILVYSDAATVWIEDISLLSDGCTALRNNLPVCLFQMASLLQHMWCKSDTFLLTGCDRIICDNLFQLLTTTVWKRQRNSIRFARDWSAIIEDIRIVSDNPNVLGFPNAINFHDHRHDQSILTILAHQNDIQPFRDPGQFGNLSYPQAMAFLPPQNKMLKESEFYPQMLIHTRNKT